MFAMVLATLVACFGALTPAHGASVPSQPASGDPCVNVINTGGGSCVSGPATLSSQGQAILARKQALAQEHARVRAGTLDPAVYQRDWQAFLNQYGGPAAHASGSASTGPAAQVSRSSGTRGMSALTPNCISPCDGSWNVVGISQTPQTTTYYCGPATAYEMLGYQMIHNGLGSTTGPGPAPMPIVDHGQVVWGQAIGPVGPDTFQNAVVRMEDLTTGQMTTLATKAGAPTFQWPWVIWGQVTTGSDGYENIKNLQTGQEMQLQVKAASLVLAGKSLAYDDINSLYLIDDMTQTPLSPYQLMSASGSIHYQWVSLSDRLVAWTEDTGVEVWDRTQHVFVQLPISNGRSDSWVQGHLLVWFDPEPADQQQQDTRNNLIPTPTLDVVDTTTLPAAPVK